MQFGHDTRDGDSQASMNQLSLIQRDLQHIWHPCSQMKDFEHSPPFVIQRAQGSYLYTDQGLIIDAISSWPDWYED